MADEAFTKLVDDIRANGQLDLIAVTSGGEIINGVHRAKACVIVGVKPKTTVYLDKDSSALLKPETIAAGEI